MSSTVRPTVTADHVAGLDWRTYRILYENNYRKKGKLPHILHQAYHGDIIAVVYIGRVNAVIVGYTLVHVTPDGCIQVNSWVMSSERGRGYGTVIYNRAREDYNIPSLYDPSKSILTLLETMNNNYKT